MKRVRRGHCRTIVKSEYIENTVKPKCYGTWILTLSCGHLVFRVCPRSARFHCAYCNDNNCTLSRPQSKLERLWSDTKAWAFSHKNASFILLNAKTRLPEVAVYRNPHYHELQLAQFMHDVAECEYWRKEREDND